MLVSVLSVQYLAVHIWKVKNAFNVSRTENELSTTTDGGNPYTTETPENPVLLTMNEIRSRQVALLSNGVAETEAEGSHCNVADETSYPRLTNKENCSRDEGSVEQNSTC